MTIAEEAAATMRLAGAEIERLRAENERLTNRLGKHECPKCGSEAVSHQGVGTVAGMETHYSHCLDCNHQWDHA